MDFMNQVAQDLAHLPAETLWLLRGIQLGLQMASEVSTTTRQEATRYEAKTPAPTGSAVCNAAYR